MNIPIKFRSHMMLFIWKKNWFSLSTARLFGLIKKPNEDILFKGILLSLDREEFKFKDSKLYSVINSNEKRINCVVNSMESVSFW